jgi:hypothetical protein
MALLLCDKAFFYHFKQTTLIDLDILNVFPLLANNGN